MKNDKVTITCYGKTKVWNRIDALSFFLVGMASCDPGSSECGRYTKIYTELKMGKTVIKDLD